jgi:hypothetical protein
MNRIIACLLVVSIFGILLFTVACGPSGYESGSGDPAKSEGQETQEGISPDQKEPVTPPADPTAGGTPPPASKTD